MADVVDYYLAKSQVPTSQTVNNRSSGKFKEAVLIHTTVKSNTEKPAPNELDETITKMGCFPYVEWLARRYKKYGEKSGYWWAYLKAHGLANYCVAIDPREERYRLVYDIEESWYKGKHPLTYIEQRELTKEHNCMLETYRDDVKNDFDSIKRDENQLSIDDIFNEGNMEVLLEFSKNMFKISKGCSERFLSVTKNILSSCVEVLSKSGMMALCGFSVIALGSVAKGEATPYSDLEYAFIVESYDNYFQSLAVESYFRIGNLCESPLKTFDIAELQDDDLPLPNIPTVGYRIDGIKKKAGNIPSGRPGGEQLILTVDSFMKLYKREAKSQFDGIAGDKSDMLSSSVLIYSSYGHHCPLYDRLHQEITLFEVSHSKADVFVNRKRLHSFAHDIEEYNYLPDETRYLTADAYDIKVKVHIFRYPTLLANNLRVCMALPNFYPWETFSHMYESGLLSDEYHRYLQIVLALSIYIRTKSYISLETQAESVSLYTSTKALDKQVYHVPQNIFVILGCLLIPIKRSIRFKLRHCFNLVNSSGNIMSLVSMLIEAIHVNKEDFMVKVTLLHFIEDDIAALDELNKGVGGNIESVSCVKFIEVIRKRCSAVKSNKDESSNSKNVEYEYLRLCCFVLENNEKYTCAVDFYSWLQTYEEFPSRCAYYKLRTALCMTKLQNFKAAENLLHQALNLLREALGLNAHQDFLQSLHHIVKSDKLSDKTFEIFTYVATAHKGLGNCFLNSRTYDLEKSLQALTITESISSLVFQAILGSQLSTLPVLNIDSVDQYLQLIDVKRCSPRVRLSFYNLTETYKRLCAVHLKNCSVSVALKYATGALNILVYLIGTKTNHPDVAGSYHDLATVYNQMNELSTASSYYFEALDMYTSLYGEKTNHSNVATLYFNIVQMNIKTGDYFTALNYGTKALEMYTAILGLGSTHINIAQCNDVLGRIHTGMGNYEIALDYYLKALNMNQSLLGQNTNHHEIQIIYEDITELYIKMGENKAALEYHIRSLEMLQALPMTKNNTREISISYLGLADIYMDISNTTCCHDYAYTCYNNALMISVNTDNVLQTCAILCRLADISTKRSSTNLALKFVQMASHKVFSACKLVPNILHQIGKCYLNLGSFENAWLFLHLALHSYQSVSDRKPEELVNIHLSISHLLLHLGHVSQALEHSQQALNITDNLLSTQKYPIPKYIQLNKKAETLVDSIHLIKCCQYQFSQFRYLS